MHKTTSFFPKTPHKNAANLMHHLLDIIHPMQHLKEDSSRKLYEHL